MSHGAPLSDTPARPSWFLDAHVRRLGAVQRAAGHLQPDPIPPLTATDRRRLLPPGPSMALASVERYGTLILLLLLMVGPLGIIWRFVDMIATFILAITHHDGGEALRKRVLTACGRAGSFTWALPRSGQLEEAPGGERMLLLRRRLARIDHGVRPLHRHPREHRHMVVDWLAPDRSAEGDIFIQSHIPSTPSCTAPLHDHAAAVAGAQPDLQGAAPEQTTATCRRTAFSATRSSRPRHPDVRRHARPVGIDQVRTSS